MKNSQMKHNNDFGIVVLDKGIPIYQIFSRNPVEVMRKAIGFVIRKYQVD
jgi:hypothetical protein